MAGKVLGRVEIYLNGELLINKAGATASGIGLNTPGGIPVERKEVLGDTGLHGFVEEPVIAACEVTVTDTAGFALETYAQVFENGTLLFQAAGGNGKKYTMREATCSNNFTVTAGEGETALRFMGAKWEEEPGS
jgi:hypothetical protein